MTIKMIELSELSTIQPNQQKTKQKSAWAIQAEFPHIITKSDSLKDTPFSRKFANIQAAFEYRRSISLYYFKSWKAYKEYDNNRNGECLVQSA